MPPLNQILLSPPSIRARDRKPTADGDGECRQGLAACYEQIAFCRKQLGAVAGTERDQLERTIAGLLEDVVNVTEAQAEFT